MEGVRGTWAGLRAAVEPALTPAGARLETLSPAEQQALLQAVNAVINDEILPAYDRLLSYLGDDYFAAAPTSVGISISRRRNYYAYLTRHFTAMNRQEVGFRQAHGGNRRRDGCRARATRL
jgi:uncharacterized protein (DUF885 family)